MNNKIANALRMAATLWRVGEFARAGDWLRYAEALAGGRRK